MATGLGSGGESPRLRACVTGALIASASSLAYAAIGFVDTNSDDPQSFGDHAAVVLFSVAFFGAAVASGLLCRSEVGRSRRAAGLGLAVACWGAALAGLGNFVEDSLGVDAFGLLFGLGALTRFVGMAIAGVALITAPVWRGVGACLLLVAVGINVGEQPGFAISALAWTFLALVLVRAARSIRFATA